jgi:hypothetical protein
VGGATTRTLFTGLGHGEGEIFSYTKASVVERNFHNHLGVLAGWWSSVTLLKAAPAAKEHIENVLDAPLAKGILVLIGRTESVVLGATIGV